MESSSSPAALAGPVTKLAGFVRRYPRLFVLTGAGCGAGSGIPDYRDADGTWKHRRPVEYADFAQLLRHLES